MHISITAVAMVFTGTLAHANTTCDDLWLARNTIFKSHGYCFGSTLGKTIFGNANCTTVEPKITTELEDRVQKIWQRAKLLGCQTDQARTTLPIYNLEQRKLILHQPIATMTESACIGYKGETFSLFDAPNDGATEIGSIQKGDDIGWFHDDEKTWSFMTTLSKQDGSTPVSGWSVEKVFPNCEAAAG